MLVDLGENEREWFNFQVNQAYSAMHGWMVTGGRPKGSLLVEWTVLGSIAQKIGYVRLREYQRRLEYVKGY